MTVSIILSDILREAKPDNATEKVQKLGIEQVKNSHLTVVIASEAHGSINERGIKISRTYHKAEPYILTKEGESYPVTTGVMTEYLFLYALKMKVPWVTAEHYKFTRGLRKQFNKIVDN